MCILFVWIILVDIHYISIGKLYFDYICLLFSLLVLGILIVLARSFECYFMSVFLDSFVIVLISEP
jgi:hypothetical protein